MSKHYDIGFTSRIQFEDLFIQTLLALWAFIIKILVMYCSVLIVACMFIYIYIDIDIDTDI